MGVHHKQALVLDCTRLRERYTRITKHEPCRRSVGAGGNEALSHRETLVPVTTSDSGGLITAITVEPALFSPNADGKLDVAAVEYHVGAGATIRLEVIDGDNIVRKVLSESDALARAAPIRRGFDRLGAPMLLRKLPMALTPYPRGWYLASYSDQLSDWMMPPSV